MQYNVYINNVITVIGDKTNIMKEYFSMDTDFKLIFDFNLIIPIGLHETEKLTEWQEMELCIKRWGTTKNCFNQNISSTTNFTFQTTWGPPILVFKKLSQLHHNLIFIINYFIDNNDEHSGGILVFKKRHVIGKTCHEPYKPLNTNKLFKHKL